MIKLLLTALLALLVLTMASCSSAGDAGAELVGTLWVVKSLNDSDLLPLTALSAEFTAEGAVAGLAGCNNYTTSYTTNEDQISFGEQIASTQKFCTEPINAQEQDYFQALSQVTTFEIRRHEAGGDQLELRDEAGDPVIVYDAQNQELSGSSWQVIAYNNGRGGVTTLIIGTEITANFGEDGRLTGNAGCNDYFADYETDGEEISIGPAGATEKFCAEPEGVMDQESEYLAALATAATFKIEVNSMNMRTVDGATVANFSRNTE